MPVALNWMESERSLLAATLNTQKHASAGPSDRIAAGKGRTEKVSKLDNGKEFNKPTLSTTETK